MSYVIVGCEESQTLTNIFRDMGYEAYSVDLLPCSGGHPEWHLQKSIFDVDLSGCNLLIAHPPCTYLTRAQAAKLFEKNPGRYELQKEAAQFFIDCWNLPVKHICLENPVPLKGCGLPKYSQVIQPYNFGEPYSKQTCLWLKNLPFLFNTCICEDYKSFVFTRHGSRERSKSFPGIARAMAVQWQSYI